MPDFRDSFTAREVCEGMLTEITVKEDRGRKMFSVPVAEFFGSSPGAIFLVAFSFILVAIVRQDSKV